MVIGTQAILIGSVVLALVIMRRCMANHKRRRWFFFGFYSWILLALVLSGVEVVVIAIGCPTLPIMRTLLWIDRTVLVSGFLAIGLSCRQIQKANVADYDRA